MPKRTLAVGWLSISDFSIRAGQSGRATDTVSQVIGLNGGWFLRPLLATQRNELLRIINSFPPKKVYWDFIRVGHIWLCLRSSSDLPQININRLRRSPPPHPSHRCFWSSPREIQLKSSFVRGIWPKSKFRNLRRFKMSLIFWLPFGTWTPTTTITTTTRKWRKKPLPFPPGDHSMDKKKKKKKTANEAVDVPCTSQPSETHLWFKVTYRHELTIHLDSN